MVSDLDKSQILQLAKKYGAAQVVLFGSSLARDDEAHDIDLAVRGIHPSKFFKLYGELILALSKPVDLIDLDRDTPFSRMVTREGVPVDG